MVGKWDADEEAKDVKTYETKEGAEWGLDYILKKYLRTKGIKIDPTKPLDDAIDLVSNTLYYDIEFHSLHYKIIEFLFIMIKKRMTFIL